MNENEKRLTAENLKLRGELVALKRAFLNQQNMLNAMQAHEIERDASQLQQEVDAYNASVPAQSEEVGGHMDLDLAHAVTGQ